MAKAPPAFLAKKGPAGTAAVVKGKGKPPAFLAKKAPAGGKKPNPFAK